LTWLLTAIAFCFSCADNNNNNNNYETSELCETTYEAAARCETNLATPSGYSSSYWYPDTSGCTYINNVLPKMVVASRASSSGSGGGAATGFAVIFGMSSVVLGAYSFFLYRKIHRAKVNLQHTDGSLA
jgi:hypothetical protein